MDDMVSRGIEPICGWEWVRQHEHDLDGWTPSIEIVRPGSKQTFNIKSREAMNQVVRIMRANRRERG